MTTQYEPGEAQGDPTVPTSPPLVAPPDVEEPNPEPEERHDGHETGDDHREVEA